MIAVAYDLLPPVGLWLGTVAWLLYIFCLSELSHHESKKLDLMPVLSALTSYKQSYIASLRDEELPLSQA